MALIADLPTSLHTSRGEIVIRPSAEGETAAYRDLRLDALRDSPHAFGADYAENLAQPTADWEERVRGNIASDDQTLVVAAAEDRLVGMTGIRRGTSPKMRHGAFLWGVYVRPAWRGQGIAGALIEACVDWARSKGIVVVRLAVVTTNTAAIRCYMRCGFLGYGVEPKAIRYDGVYYDEILMARHLA
jgi:RimJ/RimL family protein N-acetyltransferase